MIDQKEKLRKQCHLLFHQNNEIARNKPTQGVKKNTVLRKLLETDERNLKNV